MTLSEIASDVGWYFRHRDLIGRVLGNTDVRDLIDAAKELGGVGPAPSNPALLHETLVNAGVDTKKLAEEIHPEGQTPAQI